MYKYSILNEMDEMRNIFRNFFNEWDAFESATDYPSIKIYEANDIVQIEALVPGIKPEDLNVELIDGHLTIEGEKKANYKNTHYIKKERYFGKFKKSIKLPYGVDENSSEAKVDNGILTITLAKTEDAKPKKIQIK